MMSNETMKDKKYIEKKKSIIRVLNELNVEISTGNWREGTDWNYKRKVGETISDNKDIIAEKILEKFGMKEKTKFS